MLRNFYSRAFRFSWSYWRRYPWAIGTVFFTRIGSTLIDVSVPIAAGRMVEAVAASAGARAAFVALAAMLGGLIIGLAEELSTYNWIGEASLVPPSYKSAVAFLIMVVLLIFRPQGLFKGRLL